MLTYIKIYIIAFLIFFIIDLVWLGLIAKDLYQSKIGFLLKENYNMIAAGLFYTIYIIALVFFVINPADSWQHALFAGMFFGFITYATYDMTNLATIKDWPVSLTIIDICWGTFLGGSTSALTYFLIEII